ncbi:MAG: SOS response-associated peptidase [Candidatus Nealsonbacteria bacterium]|nr:SOS response-associated peptidase [Candidatus Nealsonbacteria bacterium]
MCGRFTLRASAAVIAEQFAVFDLAPLAARFNIAPSQPVPVIRLAPEQTEPQRELVGLHWGLIPSWAKDPAIGNRMINARSETVAEKPAYRAALRRRRCLVVADGFYEWQGTGRRKQPYFIRMRDDRPFAFAGLWESWEGPDHSAVESCTLITTGPNGLLRDIHDRMPAILSPEDYPRWLDGSVQDPKHLLPLLRPHPSEPMEAYPVGTRVNNPANDVPECIEPRRDLFS